MTLLAIAAVTTTTKAIEPDIKEHIHSWLRGAFDNTNARIFMKAGALRKLTTELEDPSDESEDMGEKPKKREPPLEDRVRLIHEASRILRSNPLFLYSLLGFRIMLSVFLHFACACGETGVEPPGLGSSLA